MYKNKTFLGITNARGGSKGIPRKNIKLLAGKPLIQYTIDEINKSKYLDRYIVSSDDDEIIDIARQLGADIPYKRPSSLGADNIRQIDVVIDLINNLSLQGENYDFIVLLQTTTPFREINDLDESIEKMINGGYNSVLSINEVWHEHPYDIYTLNEGRLNKLIQGKTKQRQEYENFYIRNGMIYIIKVEELLKKRSFIGSNPYLHITDVERSINIDQKLDWFLAESIIKNKGENNE